MDSYTELMKDNLFIEQDDEDYSEKLKRALEMFRSFDEALSSFIVKKGYSGDMEDVSAKIEFIRGKFKNADMDIPRGIGKWFTEHKRIEKNTAIQFCFAFNLNVDEANDFFRRISLTRGFDCHDREEIVYYFALKNGLSYQKAREVIQEIPKAAPEKIDFDGEMVYTSSIVKEIDRLRTAQELISFMKENISQFAYNNARAYTDIRDLWQDITDVNTGIAVREKRDFDIRFDDEKYINNYIPNAIEAKNDSLWTTYLQILGLLGNNMKNNAERSIKSILKESKLIHVFAEDCFPDRDGLQKILNGVHVSDEKVRKMLILLLFYKECGKLAVESKSYEITGAASERILSGINRHLLDAGYPDLYEGNPYDWMFLYCINTNIPLVVFREDFMRESFYQSLE